MVRQAVQAAAAETPTNGSAAPAIGLHSTAARLRAERAIDSGPRPAPISSEWHRRTVHASHVQAIAAPLPDNRADSALVSRGLSISRARHMRRRARIA
jgi:hypothetical protein